MLKSGLVSVSFRKNCTKEILNEMANCNLELIEWGGDIHVPHNDLDKAQSVGRLTKEYNIKTAAYGSYYRIGVSKDFDDVLKNAVALNANTIRVWGYNKGSADIGDEEFKMIVAEAKELSSIVKPYNIDISLECHCDTVMDNYKSGIKFFEAVGCENIKSYWQPNQYYDFNYNIEALKALLPITTNIHVFQWDNKARYPLIEGEKYWEKYIDIISSDGKDHGMLLEFMHDDNLSSLRETARVLNGWISNK